MLKTQTCRIQIRSGSRSCRWSFLGLTIIARNVLIPDSVIQHLKINGDNSQIDISVGQPNEHIAFDQETRNLSLVKAVSREDTTTINMKLQCQIIATTQTVEPLFSTIVLINACLLACEPEITIYKIFNVMHNSWHFFL